MKLLQVYDVNIGPRHVTVVATSERAAIDRALGFVGASWPADMEPPFQATPLMHAEGLAIDGSLDDLQKHVARVADASRLRDEVVARAGSVEAALEHHRIKLEAAKRVLAELREVLPLVNLRLPEVIVPTMLALHEYDETLDP